MTEVIVVLQQQSPSHFSSTSSSSPSSLQNDSRTSNANNDRIVGDEEEAGFERTRKVRERYQGDQVSVVELLLTAFRRSLIGPCSATPRRDFSLSSSLSSLSPRRKVMEIGWPSNVRHVAHVTFDRFNGFLGLPVEFEPHVPLRPPSASANVFGVSTESMQLSFDSRGNSVPTILLMMQRQLYAQGGLQIEGIFRINAENSREEYVRDQLNSGIIPDDIDVHCLAGLIKAWFRELPTGLLDSISPEQVIQSQSEEECARLVSLLPPTQSTLLDWAINLMADVAQMENLNKMNARNIAMVFAPNMTQMADPLTALMYAVQVMNFLQTLVTKTLKERADSVVETSPETPRAGPSDEDGHQASTQLRNKEHKKEEIGDKNSSLVENDLSSSTITGDSSPSVLLSSIENIITHNNNDNRLIPTAVPQDGFKPPRIASKNNKTGQSSASPSLKKGSKRPGILGRINSRKELVEAWR